MQCFRRCRRHFVWICTCEEFPPTRSERQRAGVLTDHDGRWRLNRRKSVGI